MQQSSGGGFFDLTASDTLDATLDAFLAREQRRAENPNQDEEDRDQLLDAPGFVTQRPGVEPVQPRTKKVTAGSGQNAQSQPTGRVKVAGIEVNTTAALIAASAGAVALALWLTG